MSTESRKLFDGLGVDLPSEYFTPFHQSGNFHEYLDFSEMVSQDLPHGILKI